MITHTGPCNAHNTSRYGDTDAIMVDSKTTDLSKIPSEWVVKFSTNVTRNSTKKYAAIVGH